MKSPCAEQESPNVDGWARWEWSFVSPTRLDIHWGSLMVRVYVQNGASMPELSLADLAVIETPRSRAAALGPVDGLRFQGDGGALAMGMQVLGCNTTHVRTTNSMYTLGSASGGGSVNGTITVVQQIDMERPVGRWALSASLRGLSVLDDTPARCVLSNSEISIGVQADGLLGLVPQGENQELTATLTSLIGGSFNRFTDGHLVSLDDWGGLTVTPAIPRGSGILPRAKLLKDPRTGQVPRFGQLERGDIETVEDLSPGWQ